MNLLAEPVISVSSTERLSLPALLAAMARGKVTQFSALRPHQRPSWHMFLVQLAALAIWTAKRVDVPDESTAWTQLLRALTPDHADDAPWRMVVENRAKPAFLQPPAPENLKWSPVATPDALDLLITARNHDIKQSVARDATIEDWLFALVSLQTSAGYDGKGNYGIARMNGGSSSRPMLGLAPAQDRKFPLNPSAWWARDVQQLLERRQAGDGPEFGCIGGPALLWCLDWPEGEQLDLRQIDPLFIEICRRVRLVGTEQARSVLRATSVAARIDAKIYHGNVGDPWAPVHIGEGKSLTLGGGNFHYKRLCELMFGGDWQVPMLATRAPNENAGDTLLVAEALSRGKQQNGRPSRAASYRFRMARCVCFSPRRPPNSQRNRWRRSRHSTRLCATPLPCWQHAATGKVWAKHSTRFQDRREAGSTARPTGCSFLISGNALRRTTQTIPKQQTTRATNSGVYCSMPPRLS